MAIALKDYEPAVMAGATVTVSGAMAQIADTNNNESIILTATTSAVNELTMANAATGNSPSLKASGDDSNVNFTLGGKGTGGIILAQAGSTTTNALDITSTGLTTGKIIDISDLDAITTGKAIHIDATGTTQTHGILVHIDSASTALTSTGRLLLVDHTGNAGVSNINSEFKSAAADETVIAQVTASAALALGKALNISGAAVTTGTLLNISDNTAHTTGTALNVVTNSADTGTRSLVNIKQDHASASGATPLTIANDNATMPLIAGTAAATSTNYFKFATVNSVTIWIGAGTTANGNLSGTAGDICLNGGSNKPEYCTGTTSWTALV